MALLPKIECMKSSLSATVVLTFLVLFGRKAKRYETIETLFNCLFSRAIHIEAAKLLSTDSFIMYLWRFIGRRGNARLLESGNGHNFVGASLDPSKPFTFWTKWTIRIIRKSISSCKITVVSGCRKRVVHLQVADWWHMGETNQNC